jgi:transcriptional regulator with XRE-family HTH domain
MCGVTPRSTTVSDVSDEADLTAADKRFAENLRAARERAGLSQRELAQEMADLGFRFRQQTIARIEAADRVVGVGESRALARACRTTVDALVRPGALARDAWLIRDAARKVRETRDQMEALHLIGSNARADLERLIRAAEDAGRSDAIAEEIAIGRRALNPVPSPSAQHGYGGGTVNDRNQPDVTGHIK